MTRIAIVYFTNTDVTGQLVRTLSAAATTSGAQVLRRRIAGADIVEGRFHNAETFEAVSRADAVVFATPTYMGGPSAQFKAFADASSELWSRQAWAGKLATGVTSGNGLNGDQAGTLRYLATLAGQHGMLWLGLDSAHGYNSNLNRLGCPHGVVAQSTDGNLHEADRASAKHLGRRLAEFADRLAVHDANPSTPIAESV